LRTTFKRLPQLRGDQAPVSTHSFGGRGDFYATRITRGLSYEYNAQTYDYLATHQLLDDGKNLYQVNTYIQSGTNNSEANDAINTLSSISSSNINNPNSDSDGDGVKNFDEIILFGTDPYFAPAPQVSLLQGPTITSSLAAISIPKGTQIAPYTITTNFSANAFSAAGLPAGLKLNATTGTITGIPTKKGTFKVSATASKKTSGKISSSVTVTKAITVL
jgi:hypothetical protein